MFKNYLKIAWRNIRKNKIYSYINIFGLALGMAVTLIVGLWIADELNYNSYFIHNDRIAKIHQRQTVNGVTKANQTIPLALEFELRDRFGDYFDHIVMSSNTNSRYLKYKDITLSSRGNFMQSDAPDLLNLEIIEGDNKGLKETNSIMLSSSTASALFGSESAIGKVVKSDNKHNMVVTGVFKDIPSNNDFHDVHFLMPWKHYLNTRWGWLENKNSNWDYNSFHLYVQLSKEAQVIDVSTKIENVKKHTDPRGDKFNPRLFVFPMKDWYLRSNFENGIQTGGRIENLWLFGIIGVIILILACINFMNLTTARSQKRALEVGIRKSIGSTRRQLIYQFLSESFLLILCAFIVAIVLTLISLNAFNALSGKNVIFPWTSILFWGISILFISVTAVLSGSYPALFLSSFNPIKVLNGTFKIGGFSTLPRKILVIIQFTASLALIIGTIVVMSQIQYSKDRPLGFNKSQLIQIPTSSQDFLGKYEMIRMQFLNSGAITEMSWSSSPSTEVWFYASGYEWDGKSKGFNESFAQTGVSYDYVPSLNMRLIKGRNFSRDFPTDSTAVILNETAITYMGLEDPVGKYIRHTEPSEQDFPLKIIGVVEDVINNSPYESVNPQIYHFGHGYGGFYNLRLNPNQDTRTNLKIIEKVFKDNFTNLPYQYDFVDEEYAKKFITEERIASLAKVLTVLAILISCLGLFGLASFIAERRTKEIGVRKVLGASVFNLWGMLSKDFITLVLIACGIAIPITYYCMNNWLQHYEYRTEISFWIIVIAVLGILSLTIMTISFQTIKTAIANPIKSLKTE
ncbi:ABC transporter permease [Aquimarina addita]|uniref:ABC transporter permease n=1 Tax=Aquimarina addita TaxID=870485 RepID=A0ABP6USB5_9FLAO